MEIRELAKEEYASALALSWQVFRAFEAPDYTVQGTQAFYNAIHDPDYLAQLRLYGAFDAGALAGVLAVRSGGTHIALFFVAGAYHRRGVGKQLFLRAAADNPGDEMTVNSSPYAVEVYRHLGFCETAPEQIAGGIRFTPMRCVTRRADCPCKRVRCPRHGACVSCREHHKTKTHPVFCQRPAKGQTRGQN